MAGRLKCPFECRPWFLIGLGWLPIIVGILLALSFVIPYCVAVGLRHLNPDFPYISDSGTMPPESCLFGQLLNMAAALGMAGIYVRYKQVELYGEHYSSDRLNRVNRAGLVMGLIACFGMSIVANFQIGNIVSMHFLGAFLLFLPGAIYGFLHAWISYKMHPDHASRVICHVRLLLSLIIALSFTLCTLFTLISIKLSKKNGLNLNWEPQDGGYPEHIVATSSEWIVAVAFLLYFFTFIREFQKIVLHAELKHNYSYYNNVIETSVYPPVPNYNNSTDAFISPLHV